MNEELKKQRAELERDQVRWRSEKAAIQRFLQNKEARKFALTKQVSIWEKRATEIRAEIDKLEKSQSLLQRSANALAREIGDRNKELADINNQILAFEGQLDDRKAEVDQEMAQYKTDAMVRIKEAIDLLVGKQAEANKTLNGIKKKITEARNERELIDAELEKRKTEVAEQVQVLSAQAEATKLEQTKLSGELQRLNDEVSSKHALKNELIDENLALHRQNKAFKDYEERAWRALSAKDQELQAREQNIAEREAMKPPIKSFLPPQ